MNNDYYNKNIVLHLALVFFLSSCSASVDMWGIDPNDYYAAHPLKNKVDKDGKLVSPDCPDWKTSPVTTYSNTKQGNIGCATVNNLGHMIADPRDLERGSSGGNVTPDPDRSADAIVNYRTLNSKSTASSSAGTSATSAAETASGSSEK